MLQVETQISAPLEVVWDCFTNPNHVVNWNFASADWYCPKATSDFIEGGEFHYTMAAKDGSFEFDFWGTFLQIDEYATLEMTLGDGRKMSVNFETKLHETRVKEFFEPETQNSHELQQAGWQAILTNFKNYVEAL